VVYLGFDPAKGMYENNGRPVGVLDVLDKPGGKVIGTVRCYASPGTSKDELIQWLSASSDTLGSDLAREIAEGDTAGKPISYERCLEFAHAILRGAGE